MDKLVSILIPNYNKAPYLRETLDSVIAQTYQNWECIIVDDHSTDSSWGILKEYSQVDDRFRVFKRPTHLKKGGNACRNFAFEMSKGEYVNWFDSDDVMVRNFIEVKIKAIISASKNVDAVVSKIIFFDSLSRTEYSKELIPEFSILELDYLDKNFHFTICGPLIRKDKLLDLKLFDDRVKVGQEKEFFYRLILNGVKFLIINEKLAKYRKSDNSIVFRFKGRYKEFDNLLHKYLMARNLVRSDKFTSSANGFINRQLYWFFISILKEKKYLWLFDWFYFFVIFQIKKCLI